MVISDDQPLLNGKGLGTMPRFSPLPLIVYQVVDGEVGRRVDPVLKCSFVSWIGF